MYLFCGSSYWRDLIQPPKYNYNTTPCHACGHTSILFHFCLFLSFRQICAHQHDLVCLGYLPGSISNHKEPFDWQNNARTPTYFFLTPQKQPLFNFLFRSVTQPRIFRYFFPWQSSPSYFPSIHPYINPIHPFFNPSTPPCWSDEKWSRLSMEQKPGLVLFSGFSMWCVFLFWLHFWDLGIETHQWKYTTLHNNTKK